MTWQPRADTIRNLLVRLNSRIQDNAEALSAIGDAQVKLQTLARELGLDLKFCDLPGCGLPFAACGDKRFHSPDCQKLWNNKYCR